jgi:hypothetical protein
MDMEYINGQTEVFIREIGTKIRFLNMENTTGMMEEHIKGTGLIIICMAKACTNGLTVENMKENMSMTKNMDMEFTLIRMAVHTKVNGLMENNMVKVCL